MLARPFFNAALLASALVLAAGPAAGRLNSFAAKDRAGHAMYHLEPAASNGSTADARAGERCMVGGACFAVDTVTVAGKSEARLRVRGGQYGEHTLALPIAPHEDARLALWQLHVHSPRMPKHEYAQVYLGVVASERAEVDTDGKTPPTSLAKSHFWLLRLTHRGLNQAPQVTALFDLPWGAHKSRRDCPAATSSAKPATTCERESSYETALLIDTDADEAAPVFLLGASAQDEGRADSTCTFKRRLRADPKSGQYSLGTLPDCARYFRP